MISCHEAVLVFLAKNLIEFVLFVAKDHFRPGADLFEFGGGGWWLEFTDDNESLTDNIK